MPRWQAFRPRPGFIASSFGAPPYFLNANVARGLSATPLSGWHARRLEAAKEPLPEMLGMSELRPRRSVLTGPTRK